MNFVDNAEDEYNELDLKERLKNIDIQKNIEEIDSLVELNQKLNDYIEKYNYLVSKTHLQDILYYNIEKPYDENLLFKNDIVFKKLSSGKIRRYFSFLLIYFSN